MHTLSTDMVRAIGWTLVHSLWQGFILAMVAGILILCTRKAKPALRYNIFTLLFFMLVGSAAGTFFYELHKTRVAPLQQTAAVGVPVTPAAAAIPQITPVVNDPAAPGFIEKFITYFNEHAPLLVMAWFIIFAGKLLWLFGGLVSMQRIRYYKTTAPDAALVNMLQQLAARLRLRKRIQLLESAMVKVPTVLGMLKPLILLPVGLMAQLPPEQVEAVLLHELAHIRRRDFLVNLVQHFAETVFFFNPALLWLSARIREEREHCCDDMAIAATQSKIGYVQALVSFQELHLATGSPYAMAFPGKKKQLLARVKRILGQHNNTLNRAEKSFLLVCFSFIGILGIVFAHPVVRKAMPPAVAAVNHNRNNNHKASQPRAGQAAAGTVAAAAGNEKDKNRFSSPDPKGVAEGTTLQFAEQRNGQPYMIYLFKRAQVLYQAETDATDQIVLLKVNGKTVYRAGDNPAQIAPYSAALQTLATDYKARYQEPRQTYQPYDARYQPYNAQYDTVPVLHKPNTTYTGTIKTTYSGKEYKIYVDDNRTTGLAIDGVKVPDNELPFKYADVNAIFRKMEADDAARDRDRQQVEVQKEAMERDREKQQQVMNQQAHQRQMDAAAAEQQKNAAERDREKQQHTINQQALKARPPLNTKTSLSLPAPLSPQAPVNANTRPIVTAQAPLNPKPPVAPQKGLAEQLLDDLAAEGLVKEQNKVSFRLDNDKFIINGKKQSQTVTRRYQKKYIKHPNDNIYFSKSGGTTTASVYIDN